VIGARSNPQVIGMNTIRQGMVLLAAIEPDRRQSRERPSPTAITVVTAMASSRERRVEWRCSTPRANQAHSI
jgi:hypothetical protein